MQKGLVVPAGLDAESAGWIRALGGAGQPREAALARLHAMLVRIAQGEAARRGPRLRITGPELDDLAYQAAADALVAITGKIGQFRGESRFTTWAYKFVIFEVSGKIARHFWSNADEPLEAEHWERLADRFGFSPEDAVEAADLLSAVRRAVREELTERQRHVFVALVLEGMPADVLAQRMGTNRNALYKTMFDARRKIRRFLVTHGHVSQERVGEQT